MYICPTCQKEIETEKDMRKHSLNCWKEQHPYHKSTPVPQGETVTIRKVDNQVLNFFNSFGVKIND